MNENVAFIYQLVKVSINPGMELTVTFVLHIAAITEKAQQDKLMECMKLKALLEYVKDGNRVCPLPIKWRELWEMLPSKQSKGEGWEPSLPLILGAWYEASPFSKAECLKHHIEYAAAKGAIDEVDVFLRELKEEDWLYY